MFDARDFKTQRLSHASAIDRRGHYRLGAAPVAPVAAAPRVSISGTGAPNPAAKMSAKRRRSAPRRRQMAPKWRLHGLRCARTRSFLR